MYFVMRVHCLLFAPNTTKTVTSYYAYERSAALKKYCLCIVVLAVSVHIFHVFSMFSARLIQKRGPCMHPCWRYKYILFRMGVLLEGPWLIWADAGALLVLCWCPFNSHLVSELFKTLAGCSWVPWHFNANVSFIYPSYPAANSHHYVSLSNLPTDQRAGRQNSRSVNNEYKPHMLRKCTSGEDVDMNTKKVYSIEWI